MPSINVNVDEGAAPALSDYAPSFGASLKASVQNTFNENVTTLGYDYLTSRPGEAPQQAVDPMSSDPASMPESLAAPSVQRLNKEEAESMVKEAGVKLSVPESGYAREALERLITRKQEQMSRQSIMDRTPWSWLGTPTRGAAMLLTGVTDPFNIASAFIPVVGEARVASMLARAGESALARIPARAAIGAAEGAVGAAVLEPAVYGLHQGLQDDYNMSDSLINLAFGGLLGGGLHVVAGGIGDAMRVGGDPYTRFSGVETRDVSRVMEYEKAVRNGEPLPKTEDWSTSMRRAAGLEPPAAAHVAESMSPEGREAVMRTAVADMAQGRTPDVEAVARYDAASTSGEKWYTGSPQEGMQTTRGLVEQSARPNANDQFAGPGHYTSTSRDLAGTYGGPTGRVYEIPQTFQNAFDFNTVNANRKSGKTLYDEMVKTLGSKTAANAELQRQGYDAITFTNPRGEKIANVFDEHPLIDAGPARTPKAPPQELRLADEVSAVKTTAERQQKPEAAMLGSPEASKAAETRVAEAPKEHAIEAAKAELADAMARLDDLQNNLELGGASPEKLARITEGLKAFDEAVKDAANIGKAIIQNALCSLRG